MRDQITNYVSACPTCQKSKRGVRKYEHLPPKEAEAEPWDKMCINLIVPYKIKKQGKPDLVCRCVTMIDPATGWFEIHQYDDKDPSLWLTSQNKNGSLHTLGQLR